MRQIGMMICGAAIALCSIASYLNFQEGNLALTVGMAVLAGVNIGNLVFLGSLK